MGTDHEMMRFALKEIIVPFLRQLGFKGSFPHFKRVSKDRIDLLMFQFSQWGKQFTIEIAKCPVEGATNASGKLTPADKVKVYKVIPPNRIRLSEPLSRINFGGKDHWFNYENGDYYKIAKEAQGMIKKAAIPWWDSKVQ